MNNPLHAAYYPDQALQRTVAIVENVQIARDTYRLRFDCPEMAARFTPGQFLMVRLAGCNDPLIGRPLAVYDTHLSADGQPVGVSVVYIVKGKLTTRLAPLKAGHQIDVWGPLGNGFAPTPARRLVMVAGGIGQTPFLTLAREYTGERAYTANNRQTPPAADSVTFCYGARNEAYFAGLEDFETTGIDIRLATDDGSRGHHGLVTDVLSQTLDQAAAEDGDLNNVRIVCCGPEPMMQAVAELARTRQAHCEVSLETPMACGIGLCFTCVATIRDEDGNADFKRTCVEGPVFNAEKIVW